MEIEDRVAERNRPRPILNRVRARSRLGQRTPSSLSRQSPFLPADRLARPGIKRFYEPDSIRVLSDALDHACRQLPAAMRENESVRRRLALHIMRDAEEGERDPIRLGWRALLSLQR